MCLEATLGLGNLILSMPSATLSGLTGYVKLELAVSVNVFMAQPRGAEMILKVARQGKGRGGSEEGQMSPTPAWGLRLGPRKFL
jgi:hypothetical protein